VPVSVPVMVPVAAEDVAAICRPVTVNCSGLFGSQPVIVTVNESFATTVCDRATDAPSDVGTPGAKVGVPTKLRVLLPAESLSW